MPGDADVNFPMDQLVRKAEEEKRQLAKADQLATENAKTRQRIMQKDPSGILGAGLRQQQRVRAAASGGVALPAFPGTFATQPPAPVPLPVFPGPFVPPMAFPPGFRVPAPVNGAPQGNVGQFGGIFAAPGPGPGAGGAQPAAPAFNGLQQALAQFKQGLASIPLKEVAFAASSVATALTFVNSSLNQKFQNAGDASELLDKRETEAFRTARLLGGDRGLAEQLKGALGTTSNPEGALQILKTAQRKAGVGQLHLPADKLLQALDIVDNGGDPGQVQQYLDNNNWAALSQYQKQIGKDLGQVGNFGSVKDSRAVNQSNTIAAQAASVKQGIAARQYDAALRIFQTRSPFAAGLWRFADSIIPLPHERLTNAFLPGMNGIADREWEAVHDSAGRPSRGSPAVSPVHGGGPDVGHSGRQAGPDLASAAMHLAVAIGEAISGTLKQKGRPSPSAGLHH